MKKIVHLFLLFGCIGFSQEYKIANQDLKGSVKSLDVFILGNNDAEIPVELKNYDTHGRLLDSKTYNDGRIKTNERFKYSNNQIIQELCDYCEDLDKEFKKFAIKENIKNPYSGYVTADPRRTHKTIKTTDKKGNVILSKSYSSEGYLIWETKLRYNKNSNLLLSENYDDEGEKTESYKKNSYNKKGLLIEEIVSGNSFESKKVYEYDNSGWKTVENHWQGDRIIEYTYEYVIEKDSSKVFTYWNYSEDNVKKLRKIDISFSENNKKITKEVTVNRGKPTNTTILEYDKNNNLITKNSFNDKDELRSKVNIKYDEDGNWIELIYSNLILVSSNGSDPKPEWRSKKYIRKIQYY